MPGGATSISSRLLWIDRFAALIVKHADDLLDAMLVEISKPSHEGLTADILPLLAACRWHRKNLTRLLRPQRLRGGPIWMPGQRIVMHREPVGRVAIVATWNYPVQLLGIQLLQAIAAGNRVVVKPSERAPRTQGLLLQLARDAGLDERWLSWTSPEREAGQALLIGERFDHIVFTGSTAVGREIAELAARSLTPTTLELSGRDSAFVLEDADVDLAARTLWYAMTINAGQTCMAPRRILVEEGASTRFTAALAPLAAAAKPRRLVDAEAAQRCWGLARDALGAGGRSVSGVAEAPNGAALRPLAIAECPADAGLVDGDHFGPVVAIVRVRDMTEALQIHHRCDQHLATSIFSRNPRRVDDLSAMLESTTITVNDALIPSAHPAAAVGGRGESGWGLSRGVEGLRAMTRPVHLSRTSWLRLPVETPSAKVLASMRRMMRWLYGGRRAVAAIATDRVAGRGGDGAPMGSPTESTPGSSMGFAPDTAPESRRIPRSQS